MFITNSKKKSDFFSTNVVSLINKHDSYQQNLEIVCKYIYFILALKIKQSSLNPFINELFKMVE